VRPRKPEDIARQIAERRFQRSTLNDGMKRESFLLPRIEARQKAKEFLERYPKAAYLSEVENWRELPGDMIEFTMRRLPSAD
jgi:hypothetical protein